VIGLLAAPDVLDRLLVLAGRLHPLVLHLPIGLAIGLAALEILRRRDDLSRVRGILVWLLALSAIVTAATGLALGEEDPDGSDTFYWHKRAGIAFAAATVLVAIAASKWPRAYRLLLALALALLLPAGHLGASLTHGENWLTKPLAALFGADGGGASPAGGADSGVGAGERAPGDADSAGATSDDGAGASAATPPPLADFAKVVAPILVARCANCHGETRQRSGLDLHTPDGIAAGSKHGPVLVAGQPADSELLVRMQLPLDDEDHMPPEEKPQPEPREIEAVEAWIAAGAPFTGHVPALAAFLDLPVLHASTEPGPGGAAPGTPDAAPALTPAASRPAALPAPEPAAGAAVQALRDAFVHVQPVAAGSPLLWVDFAAVSGATTDAGAAVLLEPVREQLAELSLARCEVGDALAPLLARMPRLQRLDLRDTRFTTAGLTALAGHPALAELVLARTRLDAGAVDALLALPALSAVRLWGAGLDAAALARLAAARPGLDIDAGTDGESLALEVEPPVAVAKAGAPVAPVTPGAPVTPVTPGAPVTPVTPVTPGAAASALAPVNATCPVSGQPVNPAFLVVDEGRVVGFCCKECPGRFFADPQRYRPLVK